MEATSDMASLSYHRGRAATLTLLAGLLLLESALGQLPAIFPRTFTIGAALSERKYCTDLERFLNDINMASSDPEHHEQADLLPAGLILNSSCVVMSSNPIVAAEMVCDTLIGSQMYMAIASHAPKGDLSPMSVSFTCGFYSIPIIGISTRDSAFSDRNVHTGFLRTVAPYSEQSVIWVEMLKSLEYTLVIFIHSTDQEGRAMLSKFQSKLEAKDVEVSLEQNIPYTAGESNFTEALSAVQHLSSRVILLFASAADAEKIYRDAEALGLIGSDYAWIVTEQSLEPPNTPLGILGLKLENGKDERRHLQDSVRIIMKAVSAMAQQGVNISEAPSSCDRGDYEWSDGYKILESLMSQVLNPNKSQTGLVQFNDVGDRIHSLYQVYNKQKNKFEVVGTYGKDQELMMAQDLIVWPGNGAKPNGIKISTHLKVVTGIALPFVYATKMVGDSCEPRDMVKKQVPCPRTNLTTGELEAFCCHGYCIDLLDKLSVEVNFTYEVHLSSDSVYGAYDRTRKSWSGMIGELIDGQSDMIVAPLTINPERATDIDFTKPFKYQGMTILVKKTTKDSNLASFLQPFQDSLWILVGLSVHVVALVLYLLDRFSPFGRFKLAKSDDTEEDALNLSGAVWFAWGVLLNSGIGEGTPRSFSARVLGMVWAGFAMIIVASYTANLAAFLVLDRPEASISGIDDARLRNPQDDFRYTTVRDSSVAMYFKRQVELSTMYRTMENHFASSEQEAIQEVKQGDLDAFIWDSSRLEYEAAKDCDLVTAGELFGRSGYGVGLAKNSPWTEKISLKILSFHETGLMEELDNLWILMYDPKCPERDTSPATLGLTNMAGVFMMVAGGIVAGVFLIFIEIAYKRHRGLKEKELELAKTAADRWRGNIEKRKLLRQTRAALRTEFLKQGISNGPPEATHTTPDTPPATTGAKQGQERNHRQPGPHPASPAVRQPSPQPASPAVGQPSPQPASPAQPWASPGRLPARRYQYQI